MGNGDECGAKAAIDEKAAKAARDNRGVQLNKNNWRYDKARSTPKSRPAPAPDHGGESEAERGT